RQGKFNLSDSYCLFDNNELCVRNLHISPYEKSTYINHEPLRDRKLLLKRRELKRLELKLNDQGLTIVPTRLFINERGLAKLEIALAKGKKLYDKRDTIKDAKGKKLYDKRDTIKDRDLKRERGDD
ncbi:MAG: SsrA-binding protein, partial [Runella slithyformis]